MAKATQSNKRSTTLDKATQAALAKATLSPENKEQVAVLVATGNAGPSSSITAEQHAPVAATRSWESQGKKDALQLLKAEGIVGEARIKIMRSVLMFAPQGYGPSTGKKQKFSPEAETYFDGWKAVRGSLPKGEQASFGIRIAETRRLLNHCIKHGQDATMEILDGEGTYHQKIAKLDTMTQQSPRQTGGQSAAANVKTLAETKDATTRIQLVAQFKTSELAEIASGLTVDQIPVLSAHIAVRCKAFDDPLAKAIGDAIVKVLLADEKAAAKEANKAVS